MYKSSKYAGLQTCRKNFEKNSKKVLTDGIPYNIIILALRNRANARNKNGVWLSLARALVWDQEVAGSNPVTPTLQLNNYAGVVQW